MKKILALGLGLSLIMSLGTANASDVAQKGDTDIFFNHGNIRRNGRQFFEYQRVVNYKDKDISLLHMRVKGDDYVSAKLVHNLTGIEIPLEQLDIKTDYVLPEDRINKPCELAAYSGEPFIDILDPFTSRNEPVKYQF